MIELTSINGELLYVRADRILLIRRYHDNGTDGSRIDLDGPQEFEIQVKESPKQVAIKVDNVRG